MAPRSGLYVALVGLVIAVLCGVAAFLKTGRISVLSENGWPTGVLLVYFGLFIGFILMLVGPVMAGAATLVKRRWLTPRQGLRMTLIGLVIIVLGAIPVYVIPETAPGESGGLRITRLFLLGLVREHGGHHPCFEEVLHEWTGF